MLLNGNECEINQSYKNLKATICTTYYDRSKTNWRIRNI